MSNELENNVKASAVMNFVEMIRGAYGAGFIDNNPTVYDIYRCAQNHVKDNYGIDTDNWDDDLAKESRAPSELEQLRKDLETAKSSLNQIASAKTAHSTWMKNIASDAISKINQQGE